MNKLLFFITLLSLNISIVSLAQEEIGEDQLNRQELIDSCLQDKGFLNSFIEKYFIDGECSQLADEAIVNLERNTSPEDQSETQRETPRVRATGSNRE